MIWLRFFFVLLCLKFGSKPIFLSKNNGREVARIKGFMVMERNGTMTAEEVETFRSLEVPNFLHDFIYRIVFEN